MSDDLAADHALYDADRHAWIERQLAALSDGRLEALDREGLAQCLSALIERDRAELSGHLVTLLQYLLEIRLQPARQTRAWKPEVTSRQQHIRRLLTTIPSLAASAPVLLAAAYGDAVRLAAAETGMPASAFPATSPWTVEAALVFVAPDPPLSIFSRRRREGD